MLLDKPFTFDRVIRLLLTAGIVWGMISLIDYLSDVLIPFAVALLLAYLINPLVEWIQSGLRIRSRPLAVALSLLALASALSGAIVAITPLVLDDLAHMKQLLTGIVDKAAIQDTTVRQLPTIVWDYIKAFVADENFRQLITFGNAKELAQRVLPGVWGLFSGAMSLLFGMLGLAVIGIYLVFILLDYQVIFEGWKNLVPPQYRSSIVEVIADFTGAMRTYFRAQALIALIVGVLHAIGFWIIDLPLGILLGLGIGVLNMVPFLQIIGVIPAIIFAMLSCVETGASVWTALLQVGLVFAAAQIIQDTVLTPRIMGKVTGFNPVVILISVSIWGKLLGMLGLIIALPMTFLLYSYYRRYITHRDTAPAGESVS